MTYQAQEPIVESFSGPPGPAQPAAWRLLGLVAGSMLLHAVFFCGLLLIRPDKPVPLDIDPILVEIVPPLPNQSNLPRLAQDTDLDLPASKQVERKDTKPRTGELVRPTRMLSAAALKRKGNKVARQDLGAITTDERAEQLCALEALEQIGVWNDAYKPERMVSYSFAEVRYEGTRLIADGAAFWSHDNWHRLTFDCLLDEALGKVVDFSFRVGVIVPKDQWEDHDLTRYK